METLIGSFLDRSQAERAVDDLHRAGFSEREVGFAGHDHGRSQPHVEGALAAASAGSLAGGAIGGILGALVTGLVPGIGPVAAAGMLAGIVAGAPTGALVGGIAGALREAGVHPDHVDHYESAFRSGHNLVTVRPGERAGEAQRILSSHGADLQSPVGMAVSAATGTRPPAPDQIPLRHDEVVIERRAVPERAPTPGAGEGPNGELSIPVTEEHVR